MPVCHVIEQGQGHLIITQNPNSSAKLCCASGSMALTPSAQMKDESTALLNVEKNSRPRFHDLSVLVETKGPFNGSSSMSLGLRRWGKGTTVTSNITPRRSRQANGHHNSTSSSSRTHRQDPQVYMLPVWQCLRKRAGHICRSTCCCWRSTFTADHDSCYEATSAHLCHHYLCRDLIYLCAETSFHRQAGQAEKGSKCYR